LAKATSANQTTENLQHAFSGESQANRRYLFFAKKADDEGFKQIAKLFRAAAEAETIHASNHFKRMNGLKSTEENLNAALSGENFEYQNMYPSYITAAKQEKQESAAWSFDVAGKVEQLHAVLFAKAIQTAKSKKDIAPTDYYVCSVCGNTVEGTAPDICPICGSPKNVFFKVA